MKMLRLFLIVLVSFVTTAVFAQGKQMSKIKQRLMTELKIDNAKADSVIAIVQDFYTNARDLKTNGSLQDADRKMALQKNRKEEVARLHTHLSTEQIKKLQGIMEEMKEEKQHRKSAKDSTAAQ